MTTIPRAHITTIQTADRFRFRGLTGQAMGSSRPLIEITGVTFHGEATFTVDGVRGQIPYERIGLLIEEEIWISAEPEE